MTLIYIFHDENETKLAAKFPFHTRILVPDWWGTHVMADHYPPSLAPHRVFDALASDAQPSSVSRHRVKVSPITKFMEMRTIS